MKTFVITPLSPRAGASTLGANLAAFMAAAGGRTGFLDLSDTAVSWTGKPEELELLPSGTARSMIEEGRVEDLQTELSSHGFDRLVVTLPYAKEPYLWTFLQFDPDLILLARLETAFARSMNMFLDMIETVRRETGCTGRISGLLLKLATKGSVTDDMTARMEAIFGRDLAFVSIPHLPELAETETALLVARENPSPIGTVLSETARSLVARERNQSAAAEFGALVRVANALGGHPPGWLARAKELGIPVELKSAAGQSANEIIDELAAEIEHLQKELSEARKTQGILEEQIAELEKLPGSGPESDSKDFYAQTANLTMEVSRLRNLLDSALGDAEQVMRERDVLREELQKLQDGSAPELEISEVETETPPAATDSEALDRAVRERDAALDRASALEEEIRRYESFKDQMEELRAAFKNQIEERTVLEQNFARETEMLRSELEEARRNQEAEQAAARQRLSEEMAGISAKLTDGLALIQTLKSERDDFAAEIAALKAAAASTPPPVDDGLRAENDELRRRLAETEMHLQGYKAERDGLDDKSARLLRQIEELQRAASNPPPDTGRERLEQEASSLRSRIAETEMHLQGFRAERDHFAGQVASLSTELSKLRSEPPEIPVEVELDPDAAIRQEELSRELAEKSAELETVRSQLQQAQTRIEKLETARGIFARERNELMERLEQFRRESEEAHASSNDLIGSHQELVQTIQSDRDRVRTELEIRNSLFGRLKAQIDPLRDALKTGLREVPALRSRAEQAESRVMALEDRCRELEEKLAQMPEPGEGDREQISALKREVDDTRTRLDAAEARLAEQETQLREEFEQRASGLRDTIRLLESELDKARSASDLSAIKLQTAEKALENQTREFQQELAAKSAGTRSEVARLETTLDETRAELGRLEAKVQEAETLREELDQVRIQLVAAKSVADEASQKRLSLEARVRELEKQAEEARNAGDGSRKYEALLRELADSREELVQLRQKAGRAAIAEKIAVERAARIAQLEAELDDLSKRAGLPGRA